MPRQVQTKIAAAENEDERFSSSDQIVREILQGLYEGRYVPGQKLTETELTKRFGASRGSVREALKLLAADGAVTVNLHRGASITVLSRDDARDVLEVIEVLASLAARRAAERLKAPADVKRLQRALKALDANELDRYSFDFGQLWNRFYYVLAEISGNRELARVIPMAKGHLIRVQFRSTHGEQMERLRISDYRQTIEAILAKDGAKAERIMRKHVRVVAEVIDALPDEAFIY